ncbi:MAG: hypothetical protein KAR19_14435 [Bacteroidales bacterium]|nr:hypothetical protein [Bacteroidales bacterium]
MYCRDTYSHEQETNIFIDKDIFSWRFFADNSLRSWPGPESYPTVCNTFNRIMNIMRKNRELTTHQLKIQRFARNLVLVRSSMQSRKPVV